MLTDNKTDDAAVLVDLVDKTFEESVDINKVGTDGAYDHYHCWDMLVEIDIEPIIPPRENAIYQVDEDNVPTGSPKKPCVGCDR